MKGFFLRNANSAGDSAFSTSASTYAANGLQNLNQLVHDGATSFSFASTFSVTRAKPVVAMMSPIQSNLLFFIRKIGTYPSIPNYSDMLT